jgi:hypothetical protein
VGWVWEHRSFVIFNCLQPAESRRDAGVASGCGKLHFHLDISFVSNSLRAETFLCLFIFLLLFFGLFLLLIFFPFVVRDGVHGVDRGRQVCRAGRDVVASAEGVYRWRYKIDCRGAGEGLCAGMRILPIKMSLARQYQIRELFPEFSSPTSPYSRLVLHYEESFCHSFPPKLPVFSNMYQYKCHF